MENNLRDKISMEGMAKEAGMSLRHFNSRFKSATGEIVTKHLQLVRVDAAKVNLVNTNRPFEEISLNTGYENVSFFLRVFKKNASLTPAEYRRRFCQF